MIWLPAGRLTEKTVINSTVQNMFRLQTFWMLRSQPEFIHLTRKWKAYQNVREIIAAVKPTSLLTSKYFSQELTTHLTYLFDLWNILSSSSSPFHLHFEGNNETGKKKLPWGYQMKCWSSLHSTWVKFWKRIIDLVKREMLGNTIKSIHIAH